MEQRRDFCSGSRVRKDWRDRGLLSLQQGLHQRDQIRWQDCQGGILMKIQMPVAVKAICSNCKTVDEVYWGQYGSEQSCLNCDSAPISMEKVVS
jgi:hypothetical protein